MKYIKLIISVLIPLLAGFIGSIFTTPSITTWYAQLNKPSFTPPNWLFGPAWTLLFILMGIALYLVWNHKITSQTKTAFVFFTVQLILNITWSLIFFKFHAPGLAYLEIIVLWLAIAATLYKFYKINQTAGLLFIPYLLWVSFASFLNLSVYLLNR